MQSGNSKRQPSKLPRLISPLVDYAVHLTDFVPYLYISLPTYNSPFPKDLAYHIVLSVVNNLVVQCPVIDISIGSKFPLTICQVLISVAIFSFSFSPSLRPQFRTTTSACHSSRNSSVIHRLRSSDFFQGKYHSLYRDLCRLPLVHRWQRQCQCIEWVGLSPH